MFYLQYIIFFIITILVILLVERISIRITGKIFKKDLEEMREQERILAEYHELSLLALASKDKEAYEGFRDMMNELYWKMFFRQLIIGSTVFFITLSPYMILSELLLKEIVPPSPFSLVFAIAITYFMAKNVYYYVMDVLELRRNVKKLREKGLSL
jgi:hypothetical protein